MLSDVVSGKRALFVPRAALLSQAKGTLATTTILTRLSPGCVVAGLSRSVLCP